ncbi:acyl-CoA dehydrogenase [Erythrobacter arachoides]|uniref:Acyl-CoA dehydrogenase n=1 Tax=Aurantiacibacter arachoides TaxID=1850444 RepID=A0A845A0A7_9SPHN|nr:acyl-CoA dehydrogenase [Aurantiacibacter arachoides]
MHDALPADVDWAGVRNVIASRAANADRYDGDLGPDVDLLRSEGWLRACLKRDDGGRGWGTEPGGAQAALSALRILGRANLSAARLFEGHMNAVKLVALYGHPALRRNVAEDVRNGALLGVWGADEPDNPLGFSREMDTVRLTGAKRFASGLGLVDYAVVSAPGLDGQPQLILAPVGDAPRADASGWRMAGMQATRSGRYDFHDLILATGDLLGQPGDYLREPHFEGGVWRYCAAHLGGAEALYQEMLEALSARGRTEDSDQRRRIVACATALETARLWLTRCALEVEGPDAAESKATLSLLGREVVENACRTVIDQVDRALGMAAHEQGSPIERIKRDLALFLCQAAPDAKRERAASVLVSSGRLVEGL